MRKTLFIFSFILSGIVFSQSFEMGSGLFFYQAEGSVLRNTNTGAVYQKTSVNSKNYSSLGATMNFYIPFYSKSTDFSVGALSGISAFIKLKRGPQTISTSELYGYNQLSHPNSKASGFHVPVMVNLRMGRNATSNSVSNAGFGVGAGVTLAGFNYDDYYYDKFFYAAPSVNAELTLGPTKFRLIYLLTPYKTYYVYDTGKKEKKYNISQFSLTMSITLGDDL